MITINIIDLVDAAGLPGEPVDQHAEINISDGVDTYAWRARIPAGNDPQTWLDSQADALWLAASAAGQPVDATLNAIQEAKLWFADNPATRALFDLSLEDLETEIISQVAALFPSATAGQKGKEVKARMTTLVVVRALVFREFGEV